MESNNPSLHQTQGGSLSSARHYLFGQGFAGVRDLEDDRRTQKNVVVSFDSAPTYNGVALFYKTPGGWVQVPAGHVTYQATGQPIGSWPVGCASCSGSYRTYPKLVWDVAATLGGVDGPVEIFGHTYINGVPQTFQITSVQDVTLDQQAFGGGYATVPVGPGTVNVVTGNYMVAAADVSLGGMSVSRTFQSRADDASG